METVKLQAECELARSFTKEHMLGGDYSVELLVPDASFEGDLILVNIGKDPVFIEWDAEAWEIFTFDPGKVVVMRRCDMLKKRAVVHSYAPIDVLVIIPTAYKIVSRDKPTLTLGKLPVGTLVRWKDGAGDWSGEVTAHFPAKTFFTELPSSALSTDELFNGVNRLGDYSHYDRVVVKVAEDDYKAPRVDALSLIS